MFDPSVGRWMEADPSGFMGGDADLYRYLGNNPTNGTDPSGLQVKFVDQRPMLRLDRTITNYDNKLADRVFTLGLATNAPKFTISAALEGWRRDDSVEEKKNPTPYFRLSVSVDNSALAQAGLRNMRWMQIGRTDRYRTQDAQRPSNDGATFGVINKFPTEDAKKSGGVPLLLRARETPGDLLEQAFINVCLFS